MSLLQQFGETKCFMLLPCLHYKCMQRKLQTGAELGLPHCHLALHPLAPASLAPLLLNVGFLFPSNPYQSRPNRAERDKGSPGNLSGMVRRILSPPERGVAGSTNKTWYRVTVSKGREGVWRQEASGWQDLPLPKLEVVCASVLRLKMWHISQMLHQGYIGLGLASAWM